MGGRLLGLCLYRDKGIIWEEGRIIWAEEEGRIIWVEEEEEEGKIFYSVIHSTLHINIIHMVYTNSYEVKLKIRTQNFIFVGFIWYICES